MDFVKVTKETFSVIGKEGCTQSGSGFIQKLWDEANEHFSEIAQIIKKNPEGKPLGLWGAMSDISRSFKPWEDNFSKGLYLAGAEAPCDVLAPKGWVKWTIPSYEYLRVEVKGDSTFPDMIAYLKEQKIPLAGAVHDFTDPITGTSYMMFPIKRLDAAGQVDTYCGLSCSACGGFKEAMHCGGCIATCGKPFHVSEDSPCAVAECVKAKQAAGSGLKFCGECEKFPCELLQSYSDDPEHGDKTKDARIENCKKLKTAIVAESRKTLSNNIAVCGMNCNHCFLGQWCGGCRVEYNCCSYATICEGKVCPNLKCAAEHGLCSSEQGCYNCSELESCKIGFFDGHGLDAKTAAMFVKKHGLKAGSSILDKIEKTGAKLDDVFKNSKSVEESLAILESYL